MLNESRSNPGPSGGGKPRPTVWMDYFLFNELRMFISLSERINPFPTHTTG